MGFTETILAKRWSCEGSSTLMKSEASFTVTSTESVAVFFWSSLTVRLAW